ncbi:hypothetical protein EPUL_004987, partial [Erysiphe pulchra]
MVNGFFSNWFITYTCIDDNVLFWHRRNQDTIRSDLYSGVTDTLRNDHNPNIIGKPVILAAQFHGGDRFKAKFYEDAMAIVRVLGKPSFFMTCTANPSGTEILECLEHPKIPDFRPDLIAIVFKQKLDSILHDLKERHIFGNCNGDEYTIEYQKRSLPHAHILIFLRQEDVPCSAEQVDEFVCAQLPLVDPELAAIVKNQLTHGPCGLDHPNAPCMRDGKCSKGFPKRWCESTVLAEDSYPERGLTIVRCRGLDRASVAVEDQHDEIKMTVQGRYISPVQAILRLFAYTTHEEKPAVMLLPYHLEGEHQVSFGRNMTGAQDAAAIELQRSAFMDWMRYNAANTDGLDLCYSEFPLFYTYVRRRGWQKRKKWGLNLEWKDARLSGSINKSVTEEIDSLITDSLNFNRQTELPQHDESLRRFSAGQRAAYDHIVGAIEINCPTKLSYCKVLRVRVRPTFTRPSVISIGLKARSEIAQNRVAESHDYFVLDQVQNDESSHISDYTPEFLQSISGQGLPLGKLTSQDPRFNNKKHMISRITLTSNVDLPFTLNRRQLPLRPRFSMTINNSQGQTLNRMGVDLLTPVFPHGKLYAALSRVTDVNRLIVLLPPGSKKTNNRVYPEVLLRPPT